MPQAPSQSATLHEGDRRRRPRFRCYGSAKVLPLPANGAPVPGRIVNVSLGGCYVETGLVLRPGALTELCLTVDGIPFRTVSLVRAVREHNGFGVEFTRLTRRGQDMLREILQELARRNSLETSLSTALVPAPQEHLLLPQRPISESLPVDAHLGLPKAALAPDPSASEPAPERECTTQGELSVYVPFNIIA